MYKKDLDKHVTHLVCNDAKSRKYEYALKWGLHGVCVCVCVCVCVSVRTESAGERVLGSRRTVLFFRISHQSAPCVPPNTLTHTHTHNTYATVVTPQWFYDCVETGNCLDEHLYPVPNGSPALNPAAPESTSTHNNSNATAAGAGGAGEGGNNGAAPLSRRPSSATSAPLLAASGTVVVPGTQQGPPSHALHHNNKGLSRVGAGGGTAASSSLAAQKARDPNGNGKNVNAQQATGGAGRHRPPSADHLEGDAEEVAVPPVEENAGASDHHPMRRAQPRASDEFEAPMPRAPPSRALGKGQGTGSHARDASDTGPPSARAQQHQSRHAGDRDHGSGFINWDDNLGMRVQCLFAAHFASEEEPRSPQYRFPPYSLISLSTLSTHVIIHLTQYSR